MARNAERVSAPRLSLPLLLLLALLPPTLPAGAAAAPPLLPPRAPCSVAREPALTAAAFAARYKGRAPVVFARAENASAAAAALRARVSREALLASHGDVRVVLASSNSHSHVKREASLREYVAGVADVPVDAARAADETWYLFGDTERSERWDALTAGYEPPLDAADDEGLVVFGVGGSGSGVAFHTHGAAFGEALVGRKTWFLSPPEQRPAFDGNVAQLRWALDFREGSGGGANRFVQECDLGPGEVIYVPPQWWHATLNTEPYNAFVSVFTREKTTALR